MKKTRTLASVAGALALATGVASVALLGGGNAVAAGTPSSAFGLDLILAGTPVVEKTPAVESTDGSAVSDSLVDVPLAPVAEAGVVAVSAENGAARASVADLSAVLLDGQLAALDTLGEQLQPLCDVLDQIPLADAVNQVTGTLQESLLGPLADALDPAIDLSLLTALDLEELLPEQLGDLCDFALTGNLIGASAVVAECSGDTGTTTIEGLNGLVGSLVDTNEPNSAIAIDGVIEVVVNRQTANADGTFTVDAIYVNLLDQIQLTVASATCGEVTNDDSDPSDAPTPTPIETNVPVTG